MAKPETVCRSVQLAALPTSPDETNRSAEVVVATEAAINGLILQCRAGAVVFPSGPVPLLLDHERTVGAVAGRLERFELVAGELRALAVIADAPAAEIAWPLVRTGAVGVSVGAEVLEVLPGPDRFGPEIASSWRIREASLTPVPADPGCVIRSAAANPEALEGQTMTEQTKQPEAPEATPSAAEIRRARAVERQLQAVLTCAPEAARAEVRRLAETEGLEAARGFAIDARHAAEQQAPTRMGSYDPSAEAAASVLRRLEGGGSSFWANPSASGPSALGELVQRHYDGTATQPLDYSLRQLGFTGRSTAELVQRAMSTSDLPAHMESAGNRLAMAAFAQPPQGVRVCASLRQLDDYREVQTLDVGLVGAARVIKQGGEINFRPADEVVAKYKPERNALGTIVTPETSANDDLSAIARINREMVARCIEAEARKLAELLEGNAQGALAPDGARLFATAHNNSIATGPLGIGKIGEAVTLLRTQKSIGGALIYQTPGTLLCAPAQETTLRQLLSDQINAAEAANYNPWRDLRLEVDPLLSGQFVYLLAEGERQPLELGRVTTAPVITSEVEFSTGFLRTKAEHSFGAVVVDFRPIVRLTVAGS